MVAERFVLHQASAVGINSLQIGPGSPVMNRMEAGGETGGDRNQGVPGVTCQAKPGAAMHGNTQQVTGTTPASGVLREWVWCNRPCTGLWVWCGQVRLMPSYLDARKRFNDLRMARGFLPVVALDPSANSQAKAYGPHTPHTSPTISHVPIQHREQLFQGAVFHCEDNPTHPGRTWKRRGVDFKTWGLHGDYVGADRNEWNIILI